MSKSILIIISSPPYEGSDAAWNALRLAETSLKNGATARIFLINEGVDTGRKNLKPPEGFFDLCEMLDDLSADGVEVKYCKTCIDRCGVGEGDMTESIQAGAMKDLYGWIMDSDRVVTF